MVVRKSTSGPIPPGLGNLTDLLWLGLEENQLSGAIPAELANLINLYQLNLQNNRLNGPIPFELSALPNLWKLDLANNQLSGNIPPELGSMINLQVLKLNNNQLEGDVPGTFINLTNLLDPDENPYQPIGLDLDYNHLNIPPGYPDPLNPLHVFLFQKDPDWHFRQVLLQSSFMPLVRR